MFHMKHRERRLLANLRAAVLRRLYTYILILQLFHMKHKIFYFLIQNRHPELVSGSCYIDFRNNHPMFHVKQNLFFLIYMKILITLNIFRQIYLYYTISFNLYLLYGDNLISL